MEFVVVGVYVDVVECVYCWLVVFIGEGDWSEFVGLYLFGEGDEIVEFFWYFIVFCCLDVFVVEEVLWVVVVWYEVFFVVVGGGCLGEVFVEVGIDFFLYVVDWCD